MVMAKRECDVQARLMKRNFLRSRLPQRSSSRFASFGVYSRFCITVVLVQIDILVFKKLTETDKKWFNLELLQYLKQYRLVPYSLAQGSRSDHTLFQICFETAAEDYIRIPFPGIQTCCSSTVSWTKTCINVLLLAETEM